MKAHPTIVLFVALMLATGRLAAHTAATGNPHVPQHEHPEFVGVTTITTFDDGTTVTSSPVPNARGSYYVTVKQVLAPKEKVYSLLTLGLQGVRRSGTVTRVGTSGGTVMHYQHGNPQGTPWLAGKTINGTGLNAAGRLDPDKIEFISFTEETCQFLVTITLPTAVGDTKWAGLPSGKSGHDNTPPDTFPPN
jgi:hypothetical protein